MSQTFTLQEAISASTAYFEGDELAAKVWASKYALQDSDGNLFELTPADMHRRMAKEIARIERKYPNPMTENELFALFDHFKYIVPQGGCMSGIGNDHQLISLSNCTVVGNDSDSYGGIMRTDEEQIQLMKRRSGVGHDLSHLRPVNSPVSNAAKTSSGVASFMLRYSNSTRETAQSGRRGALMLTISVNHPDADKFIDAKMEAGKITGANISVKIDDDFMNAVEKDSTYIQKFPIHSDHPQITRETFAPALWKKIVHNAWKSAEPGVLFWDTIIRESVADCYSDLGFQTVSTNPCGELPLCTYDSCRLIALNLYSYVKNPFTQEATVDIDLLKAHARLALRIMDDIIDLELEKIDAIIEKVESDPESEDIKHVELELWKKFKDKCIKGRRTGVGITGEGDMLAALGLRYGTEEATEIAELTQRTIAYNVYFSSVNLARERGAFPIYDAAKEANNPFLNRLKELDPEFGEAMQKYGRRNIACLTIAPTGTVSLMTQTTSGIEPVFMPAYKRRRKVNPGDKDVRVDFVDEVGDSYEEFVVIHPKLKEWMKVNDMTLSKNPTKEEIDALVAKSPYHKATANDIDWLQKVRMQGRLQKWVDHSISVTINLPNDVSEELVDKLYFEAWRCGCKGCTVYRDGSRAGVLVSMGNDKPSKETTSTQPKKRPVKIKADVVRFKHNSQSWIAFVGLVNDRPYEIFTGLADDEEGIVLPKSIKSGEIEKHKGEDGEKHYRFIYTNKAGIIGTIDNLENRFSSEFWNYAKLISATLRYEMPTAKVVSLIQHLDWNNESINNWSEGVVRALKKYVKNGEKAKGQKCPNCGQESMVFQEGCLICTNCGTSKCG